MADKPDKKDYGAIEQASSDADEEDAGDMKESTGLIAAPKYPSEWEIFTLFQNDILQHFKQSFMHQANDDDITKFCAYYNKCCIDHKNFDIYQILAFESTFYNVTCIRELWDYRWKAFKAVICSMTQITAIGIILYQLIDEALEGEKYVCGNIFAYGVHHDWYMNILAFFLSLNFSFTVLSKLKGTKGLNQYTLLIGYNVIWLDHWWLYFGVIVNVLVSLGVVYASFFVVFYSETAKSMIWSFVSLWYLEKLDDALVVNSDYDRFKEAADNGFKGYDRRKARWINRKIAEYRQAKKCCLGSEKCLYLFGGIPFGVIKYFTVLCVFVMPFYFAVCW